MINNEKQMKYPRPILIIQCVLLTLSLINTASLYTIDNTDDTTEWYAAYTPPLIAQLKERIYDGGTPEEITQQAAALQDAHILHVRELQSACRNYTIVLDHAHNFRFDPALWQHLKVLEGPSNVLKIHSSEYAIYKRALRLSYLFNTGFWPRIKKLKAVVDRMPDDVAQAHIIRERARNGALSMAIKELIKKRGNQ